jgi:hypothetical protein
MMMWVGCWACHAPNMTLSDAVTSGAAVPIGAGRVPGEIYIGAVGLVVRPRLVGDASRGTGTPPYSKLPYLQGGTGIRSVWGARTQLSLARLSGASTASSRAHMDR